MELKTNFQYTYFVHPFVIKDAKYQKYILKMLKDKDCQLKLFQKEKDFKLYKYFSPKIREFLFSSFSFTSDKFNKFQELPIETRAGILVKYPCTIFEYSLKRDIQGKTDNGNVNKGIFFRIQKLEVICFNTGICFLCMKTNLEDSNRFADILNFNYKFRDINQENSNLNNYDNICLQTDSFADVNKFTDFIKGITGHNIEAMKLDVDTERFLTYSYVCIDQEAWNGDKNFENIEHNFIKYAEILPADSIANVNKDNMISFSKWKYAKMGLTKQGVTLFTSSTEMNNYTILPDEYENQYFYTYILALYKKIYLKKLGVEFQKSTNIKKARKKFIDFTKKIWIQEVTEEEIGTMFCKKINEAFETDKLYEKVKNEYDVLYKELNIERDRRTTFLILIVLVVSLVFNVLVYLKG